MKRLLRWLGGKLVYSIGFGIAFLLMIGAALFYFYGSGKPAVKVLRIGYGAGAPVRKYFLDQMVLHGKMMNLDIRLVPTSGADQTLSLIDQNNLDLGLIAGAIEDKAERKVVEITPLYMEPLQLLVKEELYEPVMKDFGQLRGKSIDLDASDSTTTLLATELLRFIGLIDAAGKAEYQAVHLPLSQLVDQHAGVSLPDAIFQIGGVPSVKIRQIVADHKYRLVPLPFGGAFNLDKFREAETPDPGVNQHLRLNKEYVEEFAIPAFTYGVLPAVPPADARTIATRLVLIGSEKLSKDSVRRVLELVFSPEVADIAKPSLSVDLLNSDFEFDRHPGTESYLSSLKPFSLDDALGAYGKVMEVWGIVIGAYFAMIGWWKSWRNRKGPPEGTTVGDFLREVLAVEAAAQSAHKDEDRARLDQQLSDIKKRSVELHLEGRLAGAEDFPALLTTLADTRTKIWGAAS